MVKYIRMYDMVLNYTVKKLIYGDVVDIMCVLYLCIYNVYLYIALF